MEGASLHPAVGFLRLKSMISNYYFLSVGLVLSFVCSRWYHANQKHHFYVQLGRSKKTTDILSILNGLCMVTSWIFLYFSFYTWFEALIAILLIQKIIFPLVFGVLSKYL